MTATSLGRRPQLSEEVAAHIRNQIMAGTVRPGQFIRMDETAAELGVSVTPVREALVSLRSEGLVESVPHRGYRVGEFGPGDIDDIFWLQGTIASKLARRAAGVITGGQIDELRSLNTRLRDAVTRGHVEAVETCEFEFHRLVNKIAGGTKLAWFLFGALRYTPSRLYASDPGWGAAAVDGHERLIDAFVRRDLETVGEQTVRHFADAAARLIMHRENGQQ